MSPRAEPSSSNSSGLAPSEGGVSVVVPSYNHARFVEKTLRSIFRQTHAPAELLVIDDGSTDGSPRIVERVLNDCPFPCELVARQNRGLCATLNEGLSRSRAPYFAYLSSDDLWHRDFLGARVSALGARPRAVLGYGHACFVDEDERVVDCTSDWAVYADGDAREMLLRTVGPMSPTVVYRREALARHGWREGARLEDYELYLRLSREGEFAFDSRPLSAWRRHAHNTSRDQKMMLEEHLRAHRNFLEAEGVGEAEIERLQTRIRFDRAKDFVRVGDRAEALRLVWRNAGGAPSALALAGTLFRLLVPHRVQLWRRDQVARRAARRHGTFGL